MVQRTKRNKSSNKAKSKNIVDTRIYSTEEKYLRNRIFDFEKKCRRSTEEHLMYCEDKYFENMSQLDWDWYRLAIHLKSRGAL